ncbi:hypothetical protein [Sutcliffiella halmapala]|uniref:hypothetical protein n=1 Tax=Sutcliffiella halmapala TaxID=79882 RepID=UPI000995C05C|nr:hypothetical protein [Sutcliffiella halmapala]
MKRPNNSLLGFSLLVCALITILVPSQFISDGIGKYEYGYPFTNITIYQIEPNNNWFGTNFFAGNDGLHINLLNIGLNIIVIYLLTYFIVSKYKNRKEIR